MTSKRRTGRIAKIRYIVDPLPKGYVYPCTIEDVRLKLEELSPSMLRNVSTIHLCNQVKMNPGVDAQIFDCSYIRIYPVPEKLRWSYGRKKPSPAFAQERVEFGAYWKKVESEWYLCWDTESLKEYTLNHVFLHEIGHSLDSVDYGTRRSEKRAEAFAHRIGRNRELKKKAKERRKRMRSRRT